GARGPSVGDERTFYDVLFDNRGKRAGYEGGVCAVENMQPPVFSCSISFSLPGGQIATQLLTTPGQRRNRLRSPAAEAATATHGAREHSSSTASANAASSSASPAHSARPENDLGERGLTRQVTRGG